MIKMLLDTKICCLRPPVHGSLPSLRSLLCRERLWGRLPYFCRKLPSYVQTETVSGSSKVIISSTLCQLIHTHIHVLIRSKSGSFRSGSVSPQSQGGWEAGLESPCSLVSPGTSHTVHIMNNSATSLESGFMVSITFSLCEGFWLCQESRALNL